MAGIRQPTFWGWLIAGSGDSPGWRALVQPWMVVDLIVGLVLGFALKIDILEAARAVLFPLASIFVGIAISWAANAHSLIQSDEIAALSERLPGGVVEYVYPFKLAILVMLLTICAWALAAIGVDVSLLSTESRQWLRGALGFLLFFLLSMSVRTSWQTVSLVMNLLTYGLKVRAITRRKAGKGIPGD